MASFLEYNEQEQAIELAKFVAKHKHKGVEPAASPLVQEAENLIKEKQMSDLLNRILSESQLIFVEAQEKEIESFFFVFLAIVKKLDHESAKEFLSKLVNTLTSTSTEEKSLLRLKLLSHIYNIFDQDPTTRFEIFVAMLRFARATHHSDVLIPHFKDTEKRVAEWGVTLKQKRELYKAIRDTLKDGNKTVEAHEWTTKFLSTFETQDEGAAEEATNAALEAIRVPDLYQFDNLMSLNPIKQMENNPSQAKVFQLLKIFVGETIESYNKFLSENPDFLKSVGLNAEECTYKMRLLSLATLGAGAAASNNEVHYSLIAKTLQVDENEVEMYVVSAISEGILEAKMDQLRRVITITRSLQRIFTRAQWGQLSESLSVWSNNVKLLIKTLHDCKHQAAVGMAAAQQQQ